ncbi:MAG: hypothetical protein ACOH2M_25050 [Cypionkella sp.]
MTAPHHLATLALTACLVLLPLTGSAEAVMGNKLLSGPTSLSQTHTTPRSKLRFDWMANGSPTRSLEKAQVIRARYRVITGQGSWICSPAGFGQRSHCYAG